MPVPRVREEEGVVSLDFGCGNIQSQMKLEDPANLLLPYLRTMTDLGAYAVAPKQIVIVGLGGGSLAHWYYRREPSSIITVAEINPAVIALRNHFQIPEDDQRFQILCGNGASLIAKTSWKIDLLLVDGFDDRGQPPELCSQRFYDDCYQSLTRSGIVVANLCDDHSHLAMNRIQRSFGDRVLMVRPEGGENIVVCATKGEPPWQLK